MATKWIDVDELELEFEKSLKDNVATDNLKKMLLLMTKMISIRCNYLFINPRIKNICVSYAYDYLLENWRNYDNTKKKSKIFAYYTEITKRTLVKVYKNPSVFINERRTKLIDRMLK
jgi:hypothetical protein